MDIKKFLILAILLIPITEGFYLNNSVLHSFGLNSEFNITYPWNLSPPYEIIVDTNYIYAENLSSSNPAQASQEGLTFNFTETNAYYNGTDAPYYSFSTPNKKIITSPLTLPTESGPTFFDVDYCNITSIVYNSASSSYSDHFFPPAYSCAANRVHLYIAGLEPGENIFHIESDISLSNCSGGSSSVLKFSVFDEDQPPLNLNATAEVNIQYWENPYFLRNFSHIYTGNDTYFICLEPSEATIHSNIYIKYNTSSGFTHRHYLENYTLNTTTQRNLTIYNTNTTTGYSKLKITTRYQQTYNYFVNVITSLLRFYPGENVWRKVQMDKAGDYGLNVFNIKERITDYMLEFKDEQNNLLAQTQMLKFECDATTNYCDLTYLLDEYSPGSIASGFTPSSSMNNDTKILTVSWSDATGTTEKVKITVQKQTMAGEIEIAQEVFYAATGATTYNLSDYTGEVMLIIEANDQTVSRDYVNTQSSQLGNFLSIEDKSLWTAGILMTVVGFGMFSPVGAILSAIFGIILVAFLGIAPFITTPFIIVVCAMGIAIGLKIKR